jgi:hypothetical protein
VEREDVALRRRGKPSIRLSLESRKASSAAGTEVAANVLADALYMVPEMPARLPALLERRFPRGTLPAAGGTPQLHPGVR